MNLSAVKRIATLTSLVVLFVFSTALAQEVQLGKTTSATTTPNAEETKSKNKTNPFEAPYPFTADEFAEKLLKVLDNPEGFISKEQVEAIFDVMLPELDRSNRADPNDKSKLFGVTGGKNWYFTLVLGDNNLQDSNFVFEWAKPTDKSIVTFLEPPFGMCIDPTYMTKGIEKRGWKLKSEMRIINQPIPFGNFYRQGIRGAIRLTISRTSNCLLGVIMSSSVLNTY